MIKAMFYADRTELLVRDEGPGIADIELAMQPGYSTASALAREMGFGAGTGLSNIKRYPDECTINSVVGTGTTIHLVIRHDIANAPLS
jgi:anti-sigma regulatory factor (Ser/Thr protein kinase)